MKNGVNDRGIDPAGYSEAPNDIVLNDQVITPGALVEASDGPVGRVERLVSGGGKGLGSLIVRDASGHSLDVGANLVARIVPDQPAPHILLSVSRAQLGLGSSKRRRQRGARVEQSADTAIAPVTGVATERGATAATPTRESLAEGEITLPIAEEHLVTHTRWQERGRVHLRKRVRYEDQRQIVPLSFEEVNVEHIAPDLYDANAAQSPDELVIPILEERLIIRKETVVKEYLRVRKQMRSKDYEVRAQLRHEEAQLEEEANPAFGGEALPLLHDASDTGASGDATAGMGR